jgi:hypothetical protein
MSFRYDPELVAKNWPPQGPAIIGTPTATEPQGNGERTAEAAQRLNDARKAPLVPAAAVNAALNYVAYASDPKLAIAGADMWSAKFGSRAKGDEILVRSETETRPTACMRILAAEVVRLRELECENTRLREALDRIVALGARMPEDAEEVCIAKAALSPAIPDSKP